MIKDFSIAYIIKKKLQIEVLIIICEICFFMGNLSELK